MRRHSKLCGVVACILAGRPAFVKKLSVPQTADAHLLGEVEVLGLLDATEEGEDHLKTIAQPC